jgi:hypothetical protein
MARLITSAKLGRSLLLILLALGFLWSLSAENLSATDPSPDIKITGFDGCPPDSDKIGKGAEQWSLDGDVDGNDEDDYKNGTRSIRTKREIRLRYGA